MVLKWALMTRGRKKLWNNILSSQGAGDNPSFFTSQECAPVFYRIFLCKQEVKSSRWWIVSCNKCRLWSFSTFLSPISSLRKPFLCLTFRTISICLKVTNRLISQAATKIRTWVTRKKIVTSKIFQKAPLPPPPDSHHGFFCLNLDHASRINYLELGCCCKLAHCNNIIEEQQKLEGSACFFFKCSHGKSAPQSQTVHTSRENRVLIHAAPAFRTRELEERGSTCTPWSDGWNFYFELVMVQWCDSSTW